VGGTALCWMGVAGIFLRVVWWVGKDDFIHSYMSIYRGGKLNEITYWL
jgi:hypothetical protein